MNTTNEQIPMAMAPAKVDGSIPMQADTRLPLAVQMPTPIDHQANEQEMLKTANLRGEVQDNMRSRAEKQVDEYTINNYLSSGGDLSTADGYEKAVKDLKGKVSLSTYENLNKTASAKKTQDMKLLEEAGKMKKEDFDMVQSRTESLVDMMAGPVSAYDKALEETKDPAKANEAFKAAKAAQIVVATQMKGSDGKPIYPPEALQQFEQANPEAVRARLMQSKKNLDLLGKVATIKKDEAQAQAARALADQRDNKEDAPKTLLGKLKTDLDAGLISQEAYDAAVKKANALPGSGTGAGVPEEQVTPQERSLAVNQWIQNPSSLRGMDKTYQRNVVKWAADLGVTADDVASGRAAQKFNLSSASASGRRDGQMAQVEATIPGLIKNARDLSAKVPRTAWVPLNKLMQMGEGSISDPNLKALKVANQAVSSEYQQVIARGGSNVTALTEAMHLLQTADSQEAYNAALGQVEKEVEINVKGSEKVREKFTPKHGPGSKVDPGTQKERDSDAVPIFEAEVQKAKQHLSEAKTPEEKDRADRDLKAATRELDRAKGKVGTKPAAPDDINALLQKWGK